MSRGAWAVLIWLNVVALICAFTTPVPGPDAPPRWVLKLVAVQCYIAAAVVVGCGRRREKP